MKLIILVLTLSFAGCASTKLKRCESAVEDESIQYCKKHVDGPFWMCEEPKNLMKCGEAN